MVYKLYKNTDDYKIKSILKTEQDKYKYKSFVSIHNELEIRLHLSIRPIPESLSDTRSTVGLGSYRFFETIRHRRREAAPRND